MKINISKKYIIIGISVWVIALILTITLSLVLKKDNKKIEEEPESNIVEEKEDNSKYVVKLTDQIDENGATFKEYEVSKNYKYHQIYNLKDTKVQGKINEIIHDKVTIMHDKIKDKDNNNTYTSIYYNSTGLVSIIIIGDYYEKDNNYLIYDGVNINLSTGKEISIYDLFINKEVFGSIYTKYAAKTYAISKGTLNGKVKPNNTANLEDTIFKNIQEIEKGNYSFYFDTKDIYIIVSKLEVQIPVYDVINKLIYFRKYTNNDLYNSNNGIKNIYIFSYFPVVGDYYNIKNVNDNIFVDFHIKHSEDSKFDYDSIYKIIKIEDTINNYIKKSTGNKFYYINGSGYVYTESENGFNYANVELAYNYCNSNIKYKNDILNIVYKHKDYSMFYANQFNIINLESIKQVKCTESYKQYIVNDKGIVTINNIFKSEYNYKDELKNFFFDRYRENTGNDLAEEQLEEIYNSDKIKFVITNFGIEIYYGNNEEDYVEVEFSELDKSKLNI